MRFCSECGSAWIKVRTPKGDNTPRETCRACGTIFYSNPKIVAACIAEWQGQILLCCRAIEPRKGLWTIPGGFMENGESVQEAALREAKEESGAVITNPELFSIHNLKYNHQVYAIYRGEIADGIYSAEHETSAVKLYDKEQIPWDEIAFRVVKEALRLYVEDCKKGGFDRVHQGDIIHTEDKGTSCIHY